MTDTILLHWYRHPQFENFGDALSPQIVQRLAGSHRNVKWVSRNCSAKHLLCIGSLVDHLTPSDAQIWGSGAMKSISEPQLALPNHVFAVRGRITASRFIQDCNIFGDPGLLLPLLLPNRFFDEVQEDRGGFNVGFVPHYVDQSSLHKRFINDLENDGIKAYLINIATANVDLFAASLSKCDLVFCSSLHGLISAHALGTPAIWLQFSDLLKGDGTKSKEYFESVGIVPYSGFEFCGESVELSQVLSLWRGIPIDCQRIISFDPLPLIQAFPQLDKLVSDHQINLMADRCVRSYRGEHRKKFREPY